MPLYDCGFEDCDECRRAFGPDRSQAIARYKAREAAYAKMNADTADDHRNAATLAIVGGA